MFPAPDDCTAWLEDESGNRLPIRGVCSIGRAASNQIPLVDDRVSRRHAVIQAQQQGEFWLVDFGSRNGTFLDDKRIAQPTRLHHGARVRIGRFQFVFRHPVASQPFNPTTWLADRTVSDIKLEHCWLLVADIMDSSRLVQEIPADELPLVTGQWLSECKQTIEASSGRINQFMGDGFFAFWRDRERVEQNIHTALQALSRMQEQERPKFRFVLHLGQVAIGGVSLGEEERISGSEVHFVFREEKLCGKLGEARLLSEPAWGRLSALVKAREAGRHALSGLEGQFLFYAF
jgi:pSer/pThr/pTyr-binding forkhead associated (FHA) protein